MLHRDIVLTRSEFEAKEVPICYYTFYFLASSGFLLVRIGVRVSRILQLLQRISTLPGGLPNVFKAGFLRFRF
jgi:hypothetical protein